MQIENHTLIIGSFTQELPRLPKNAIVAVWRVPTEYRESGYFVSVTPSGGIPEIPACDSRDALLMEELELPADETAQLEAAKKERLELINSECDKALLAIKSSYPDGEVESWPQQVKEAEAFLADQQVPVPLLEAIATSRGLTVTDLAARVLTKADLFARASGVIIGKRQALEDVLTMAATIDEVSEVTW